MMKSDLVIKQFFDMLGDFKSDKIQSYLDGENPWGQPICEKDIFKIEYGFSSSIAHGNKKVLNNALLLVHRVPEKLE